MVLAFGPRSRQKPEKPLPLPPGAPRRGASGGRGGGRTGGRGSGGGRGTAAPLPPAPRPAPGAPDALQRLAAGVKQREDGRGPTPKAQHSRVEGVTRPQPRHLHSVAVGELLGCSPLQAAAHAEQPWDLQMEQEESEELYQALPQPIPPPPRAACPSSPPAPSEVPAADFSRRDAARLGGDGVAGIFGGGVDAGTMRKSGAYMSALSSIKPGLSDAQKAKQAAQREQLKRELEEQIKEKREADAQRKAALAAQEEEEERKLRAYWAAQAAQAAAEREGAARRPSVAPGVTRAQHAAATATPAAVDKGRASRAQGAVEPPLGAVSGPPPSRRGEALVQPGVAVFLPPDRAAERRGARQARQASEACSQDAEAVQPLQAGAPDQQAGAGAAVAAWRQLQELAGSQYPAAAAALLAQQQAAAALLAAANPAGAVGGLPLFPYSPILLPSLASVAAGTGAGLVAGAAHQAPSATASAAGDQVLGLLREVQREQQRMRTQLEAVAGDVTAARSERDKARQDLERVQRLLAERQAGQPQGWVAAQAAAHDIGFGSDGGLLAVTSHVLPIGAARIPSRLGSPAAGSAMHQEVEGAVLPARYRQQPLEPWQKLEQRAGGAAAGGATANQAGTGKAAGKRQGWGQLPGAGLQARGKAGPTAAKHGPVAAARHWKK